MRSNPHTFSWDEEPADERPSEFMQSTGYSVLSGYHVSNELNARVAQRRRGSGLGFKSVVLAAIIILGLSALVIQHIGHWLRP